MAGYLWEFTVSPNTIQEVVITDGFTTVTVSSPFITSAFVEGNTVSVSSSGYQTISNVSVGESSLTFTQLSYISKISDGTNTYILKDAEARQSIGNLATVASTGDFDDLTDKPTVDQTFDGTSANAQSGVAVKSAIDAAVSSAYKAAGSVAFASLPTPASTNIGNVYNVTDAFTTDSRFIEGSGKSYPAGTNVVIIDAGLITYHGWDDERHGDEVYTISSSPSVGDTIYVYSNNTMTAYSIVTSTFNTYFARNSSLDVTLSGYMFDVLAGFIDLSGYQLASTAVKHTASTAVGSSIRPVYVASNGQATQISYTIEKSVPSNAVFTDTTYSVMTGATGSAAGSSGLAPAPSAGDNNKYLKGNGTWGTDTWTYDSATKTLTIT